MRHYYTYYPKVRELEIPDSQLIGKFGPLTMPVTNRDSILAEAFEHPVNSAPLRDLATPSDHVLIVTDDALEPTPTVFPFYYVIQELHKAGVPDSHISVLIANAGHRTNSHEEVNRKIGAEMHEKYPVYQSSLNARDDSYHDFGSMHSHDGEFRIVADRRLHDATLIIGLTGTYPNRFKGYSGGYSLVFPGLGNENLTGSIYWQGASQPAEKVLGHIETPARTLIRKLGDQLPAYKFCAELVIDRSLELVACVTGKPTSTFRVGADVASRIYEAHVPERADLVIVDSHPFDHNFMQSTHALYAALCAVRDGGEIINVSPLHEALSNHTLGIAARVTSDGAVFAGHSPREGIHHHTAASAQVNAMREVLDRTSRVTYIAHGHGASDVEKFGCHLSDNLQQAFDSANSRLGGNARVALLTHGGLVVPKVA